MADTSNLSKFLSDVADAIRTKKDVIDPIPAANFDTEILSIDVGTDTSDADAVAENIEKGKTAYVNGEKITGTLEDAGSSADVMVAPTNIKIGNERGWDCVSTTYTNTDKKIHRDGWYVDQHIKFEDLAPKLGVTPDKIVSGNTILGVEGIYEGSGSGVDITDATAEAEDVIAPKVFYNNEGRQQGSITTTYESINVPKQTDKLLSDLGITGLTNLTYQISDNNTYVIGCGSTSSYSTFYIFELTDNNVKLLATYPLTHLVSSKCWTLGPIIPELNMYPLAYVTSNTTSTVYKVVLLDFNSEEIITNIIGTRDTGRYIWSLHFNPVHPNKMYICESRTNASNNTVSSSYLEDTIAYSASTNKITFSQRTYQDSWPIQSNFGQNVMASMSADGKYLIYSNYWGCDSRCGTVIVSYDDNGHYVTATTKNYGEGKAGISPSGKYIIINNKLYKHDNLATTLVGTLNIIAPVDANCYRFLESDEYIFTVSDNILYLYRVNLDTAKVEQIYTGPSGWAWVNESNPNKIVYSKNFSTLSTTRFVPGEKYTSLKIKDATYYLTEKSDATSDMILEGEIVYTKTGEMKGTMPNQTAIEIVPSTEDQIIAEGYYKNNKIKAVDSTIDINIAPENIKTGVTILGVEGTLEKIEGGSVTQDGNLQAKYLLDGYSAVVDDTLIEGTMVNYGTVDMMWSSEVQEIPTGYYDELYIPRAAASNLDGYDECSDALSVVMYGQNWKYTELNYIESTGNQFININYIPKTLHTKYEVGFMRLSVNSYWNPIINNEEDVRFGIMCTKDTNSGNDINNGQFHIGASDNMQAVTFPVENNIKYDIIADKTGISLNGTKYEIEGEVADATGTWSACINHRYISATEFSPEHSIGRWYYLRVYEDNVLVKNLVPAIETATNKVCMYDTIGRVFHHNIGEGNFISGGVKE